MMRFLNYVLWTQRTGDMIEGRTRATPFKEPMKPENDSIMGKEVLSYHREAQVKSFMAL